MPHRSNLALLVALVGIAVLLSGCTAGPGTTHAAGTLAGTTAGAILGAAASPCNRGGGAIVGAALGMMVGDTVGAAMAEDQVREEQAREEPCDRRCVDCAPRPCPRRAHVRYVCPPPCGVYVYPYARPRYYRAVPCR